MEEAPKNLSQSKRNEVRALVKNCFKNKLFSFVPYEIWINILDDGDAKSIATLAQTCWAFKELAALVGEENLNLALTFRREGQIRLAHAYLIRCVNRKNSAAMFHKAFGHWHAGWGLKRDNELAAEWFKNAANCGSAAGMAYYSFCLIKGYGVDFIDYVERSKAWSKKAKESNDSFAIGVCHNFGLGTIEDRNKAFDCFKAAAEEGNEYGQMWLGHYYYQGYGVLADFDRAFYWYSKAAHQGLAEAQMFLSNFYRDATGCEKSPENQEIWHKKGKAQHQEIQTY